jgi:hypothetical protein
MLSNYILKKSNVNTIFKDLFSTSTPNSYKLLDNHILEATLFPFLFLVLFLPSLFPSLNSLYGKERTYPEGKFKKKIPGRYFQEEEKKESIAREKSYNFKKGAV